MLCVNRHAAKSARRCQIRRSGMESDLLKGICIGLLFWLPAGAAGTLTVQRTLAHGPRMGILTGLGASVAD